MCLLAGCSSAENSKEQVGRSEEVSPRSEVKSVSARKGPFGIDIGQSVESLGTTNSLGQPGLYLVENPPKPHASFAQVAVLAYPSTGVCVIRAVGDTFENDASGYRVRGEIDSLKDAVSAKYGTSEKSDFCSAGDIKCSDEFWMMTLRDSERVYSYSWNGGGVRKAGLSSITLAAQASGYSGSYAIIEYEGLNTKACEAAKNASRAEAL